MLRSLISFSIALSSLIPLAAEARQCGLASFYGAEFNGYITANGERFNRWALTAAHPSLPFGARIKVVNQENGRSVIVRGNDRGPFYGGRIIDLSEAAFSRIASTGQGLARVCVTRI